jgi:hypothetical protein
MLQCLKTSVIKGLTPMIRFTEEDIINIHKNKVKRSEEYFKKYEILPECPVIAYKHNWDNHDYPRNLCILDFRDWVAKYNLEQVEHLAYTFKDDPELQFLRANKSTELAYPPHDLHTISNTYKDEFDFFVFNQTLEHLYNPYEAVRQIYTTLKPGGYVFTSVPTLNVPHWMPSHFTGFTPMGLATLFMGANFEIIDMGQWGNCNYIKKLFETHSWPDYKEMKAFGDVIPNEERNVCQCWILARKRL